MSTTGHFDLRVAIQQMGTHGAFLRDICFLVPVDGAVGTTVHQFFDSLCPTSIDHHDTILPARYAAVGSLRAGGILAVLARHSQIADIDARVLATFRALDIHPSMVMSGLFVGIGQPLVVNMLILAGHKAIIAVVT
jgi:hypothetical protein